MRPAGEVRQAIIQAAFDLAMPGRGATLAEITERACVSRQAARDHIPKLKSRGHLQIVGERRVDYRNRPVAEYAPVDPTTPILGHGWVDLGMCMADWVR
jgi:AcrR family transcriptional regulator